jgi:hypothetical protein
MMARKGINTINASYLRQVALSLPEFIYFQRNFLSVFVLSFCRQLIYRRDYGRKCFVSKTLVGSISSVDNNKNIVSNFVGDYIKIYF